MDVRMSVVDKVKLGAKFIRYRFVQRRLATSTTRVVSTKYGEVKGLQRKTIYDKELYFAFEGIPFAKPPLGELRFRAPQAPDPWLDVRDCTYTRSKPLQCNNVNGVEGSEDCLYLNVYTKRLESTQPLPVMVSIFGGGFQIGEATRDIYGPDYFMKQDVVLVTINYRVGALGFLSLTERELRVPGNAGLKDQLMALRWVRENIMSFNGNPENITLMGESAGGASTHIMMLTEQARGLFHRAIIQSGSALCAWAGYPNRNWAYRLARQIGYTGTDTDATDTDVLRFLQAASAHKLAAHSLTVVTREEERDYHIIAFAPVVEPYVGNDCILPRPSHELLSQAWGNDIPLIIGGNSFEGLFSYQSTLDDADYMLSAFEAMIPRPVRNASSKEQVTEMIHQLTLTYCDEDEMRDRMELFEYLHLLSVKHFWHDIHRTVLARLAYASPSTTDARTYLYRFDFDSPHFNHYRILKCGKKIRGVCHGDDISYLFYNVLARTLDKTSPEYRTIERMVGMWTAFAATGNPNCSEIAPITWQPITEGSEICLNISHNLEMLTLPEKQQLKLWDSFYKNLTLY